MRATRLTRGVVLVLLTLVCAAAVYALEAKLSANDRHFVIEAAERAHGAIELGRLARESTATVEVKQLGQRLIDDHTEGVRALGELAAKLGLTSPGEPDARLKGELKKLAGLAGPELEREAAGLIVREQERAAALYEKQATRGDSPELKAYAARTLPMLQEHVKLARALSGRKR